MTLTFVADALCEQGFSGMLNKPATLVALKDEVQRLLPSIQF